MNKSSNVVKMLTVFLGSILSLLIGMITAPIITRIVDPTEYGQLAFFTMYTSVFALCVSMGMDRAFLRFFYDTEENKRTRLLYDCIKYAIGMFGLSIPVILIGCHFVIFDANINIYVIASLFILNLLAVVADKFALNVLRVQQKSLAYAVCSVCNKLIYGISAVILVLNTDINHFLLLVVSTALASTISLIVAVLLDLKNWSLKRALEEKPFWKRSELLRYSFPIMVQGMVAVLFQSADKIMIKHFGTYSDVGIYASATYYVTLFVLFNTSITTIIEPEMYKYNAQYPGKSELFVTINKAMTFLMFFVSTSMIFSKDLLAIALGEKYREAGMIMPFLMFNPVMVVISGINSISIEIKRKSKYFIFITLSSAIANIIGNYFLIPICGAKGAAISTGLSYIFYYVLTTIISKKLFNFDIGIVKFSIMTVLFGLFALYNSWNKFNIVTVISYVAILIVLFIFYHGSISYLKEKLLSVFKRSKQI